MQAIFFFLFHLLLLPLLPRHLLRILLQFLFFFVLSNVHFPFADAIAVIITNQSYYYYFRQTINTKYYAVCYLIIISINIFVTIIIIRLIIYFFLLIPIRLPHVSPRFLFFLFPFLSYSSCPSPSPISPLPLSLPFHFLFPNSSDFLLSLVSLFFSPSFPYVPLDHAQVEASSSSF